MPISSFFSSIAPKVQRFAGQAYGALDRSVGGFLPGGAESALPPVRKVRQSVKEAGLNIAGEALNTLPDRFNLFGRYMTGVGNRNLKLDPSTLTDLRRATEKTPSFEIKTPFGRIDIPSAGPAFPQSGPVYPYGNPSIPKSVTNTLGRFTADVNPAENTMRIQDTYDMVNSAEDPDLISGKIQPQKAWNEIESMWNPAASMRNAPVKFPLKLPEKEYNIENLKKGLTVTGQSSTYSPATRFARALMYLTPVKPEPYEIDITIPMRGEIK